MKQALLIDLDGVLYQGTKVIPGAVEAIRWVQNQSIPHIFITNTTSRPRKKIIEKLAGLGFSITEESILTPPVAACKWLAKNVSGETVLFVPNSTKEDFNSIPLLEQEGNTAAAVVLGDIGEAWTFSTLNRAFT